MSRNFDDVYIVDLKIMYYTDNARELSWKRHSPKNEFKTTI